MDLNRIYTPIRKDLEKVEKNLRENFPATNSFLKKINDYLFQTKNHGKRIRPALVILSAKVSSNSDSAQVNNSPACPARGIISLAVAVELIHTASLIHDDIIDNADERHNQVTLHQKYGNQVAILAGDILYAQAFNLLSQIGISGVVKIMAEAVRKVCLGEIDETRNRETPISEEEYFTIVRNKTGALMSACCEAGATLSKKIINSTNGKDVSFLRDYGLNFGLAYQMVDDYLDLFGEKEKVGKSLGIDLKEGTFTLPLIRLREVLEQTHKSRLIKADFKSDLKNYQLKKLLIEYKILDYIREKTVYFIAKAKGKINSFCPSVYRDGLINLTEYVYQRER